MLVSFTVSATFDNGATEQFNGREGAGNDFHKVSKTPLFETKVKELPYCYTYE